MTKETGSLKASLQIILFCLAQEDRWLTGGAEARRTLGTGKAAVDEGSCGDLPAPVNSPCLLRRLPCREPAKR